MVFRKLFIIAVFFPILSSCLSLAQRTLRSDGQNLDVTQFDLPHEKSNDQDSFWSPSQRQASAQYYFLVAENLSLEGDLSKAAELYELAYNLDANAHLAAKLIATNAALGKDVKASAHKMVLLYPKSARLRHLYALILAQGSDFTLAINELKMGMELDPNEAANYVTLIELYVGLGRMEEAKKVALELSQRRPFDAVAWQWLAQIAVRLDKKEDALRASEQLYGIDSRSPESIVIHAFCLEMNGQRQQAVALYEKLYRMDPQNPQIIDKLIHTYRLMGRLDESLAILSDIADEQPNPALEVQRVILMWELGQNDEAAKALEKAVSLHPQHEPLKMLQALSLERVGDKDGAANAYQQISEASDFWPRAQLRLAVIFADEAQKSIQILENVVRAGKGDEDTYFLLGSLYRQVKNPKNAVKLYQNAYKAFPNQVEFLFMQAVALESFAPLKDIEKVLEALIAKNPKHAAGLNFLGYLYAEKNIHLDKAHELISRALKIKPKDPYYLDSLAWVYFQKNDYNRALELIDEALAESQKDEAVLFEHKAEILLKQGDTSGAKIYIEKAFSSTMEERDEERIKRRYHEIKAL
jgi:tetratricopeptide (TPR) repeat protein